MVSFFLYSTYNSTFKSFHCFNCLVLALETPNQRTFHCVIILLLSLQGPVRLGGEARDRQGHLQQEQAVHDEGGHPGHRAVLQVNGVQRQCVCVTRYAFRDSGHTRKNECMEKNPDMIVFLSAQNLDENC